MKSVRIFILLVFSFAAGSAPAGEDAAPRTVACLGQIVPGERTIKVSAPAAALVKELQVRRGDKVEAGAVFAVLRDYDSAQAALVRAERNVDLAQAKLAQVKSGERDETVAAQEALVKARQAEVDFLAARKNRHDQLYGKQLISSDQFEELGFTLAVAEASLRREQSVLDGYARGSQEEVLIAEQSLAVAQAERDEAAAALEAQLVRAPSAGEILEIHTYAGEQVGDNGLLDLGDTAHMTVRAEVYETDVSRVQVGDRATVRTLIGDRKFGGRVEEIERQVSTGRIYALDATDYADRRIVIVHIRPDDPAALAAYNNAHATVILSAP